MTTNIKNENFNSDKESNNAKKRYKNVVIAVLCVITSLTAWSGYLIVNGALSFFENPLSKNILDNVGILYILWFVGVFIALAYKIDSVLCNNKPSQEDESMPQKEIGSFKKYICPCITSFILIPIISAIAIYYTAYFIIFIFVGAVPYIAAIALLIGLGYSFYKLTRFLNGPQRGRKIITYSILVILCYAIAVLLIAESDTMLKNKENTIVEESLQTL